MRSPSVFRLSAREQVRSLTDILRISFPSASHILPDAGILRLCLSAGSGCTKNDLRGDGEIRTLDPLLARQVLSQLSYTPMISGIHLLSHTVASIVPSAA